MYIVFPVSPQLLTVNTPLLAQQFLAQLRSSSVLSAAAPAVMHTAVRIFSHRRAQVHPSCCEILSATDQSLLHKLRLKILKWRTSGRRLRSPESIWPDQFCNFFLWLPTYELNGFRDHKSSPSSMVNNHDVDGAQIRGESRGGATGETSETSAGQVIQIVSDNTKKDEMYGI